MTLGAALRELDTAMKAVLRSRVLHLVGSPDDLNPRAPPVIEAALDVALAAGVLRIRAEIQIDLDGTLAAHIDALPLSFPVLST